MNGWLKKYVAAIITVVVILVTIIVQAAVLYNNQEHLTTQMDTNCIKIEANHDSVAAIEGDIQEIKAILYRVERLVEVDR